MVVLNFPSSIVTERLAIQRSRYEDAEEIFFTYASKPEVTRYLSWPTHVSISDTRSFLSYADDAWKKGKDYSFSVRLREGSRLIGGFGAVNDNGKIQIGYVFAPNFWGSGYASEACRAMTEHIRNQSGVYRIQSFVDVDNVASARVLLKSGFVQEAVLPKWFRFVNQGNEPKDCGHYRLVL